MSDLPIHITPDGVKRPLGNRPRTGPEPRTLLKAIPDVPESEWREFDFRQSNHPIKVKDQNGFGACNGFAAATALEYARWISGASHVDLSSWYVYSILCNGVDRGSIISDALSLCRNKGVCPEADVPYGTINPNKLSSSAHSNAARFKIEIGTPLRSFREMCCAAQLRKPFNFSICVGNNFDDFDSDGVPGYSSGYGNHAVCGGLGMKKTSRNGWIILWQNSWTTRWGINGFANVSERFIDKQPYFDCYTIEAAHDDPQDSLNPRAVP